WLHLTICFPPNQMAQANHSLGTKNNSPSSLCRLKSSIQAVIEVVLGERRFREFRLSPIGRRCPSPTGVLSSEPSTSSMQWLGGMSPNLISIAPRNELNMSSNIVASEA